MRIAALKECVRLSSGKERRCSIVCPSFDYLEGEDLYTPGARCDSPRCRRNTLGSTSSLGGSLLGRYLNAVDLLNTSSFDSIKRRVRIVISCAKTICGSPLQERG